jgi:hypothetical protein
MHVVKARTADLQPEAADCNRLKLLIGSDGMTKFDVPDETGESSEYELSDRPLDIARRLHRAICAQYPNRLITLCDGDGRVLATSRLP